MNATLIASVPIVPVSMKAYVPAPIVAFRPSTKSWMAVGGIVLDLHQPHDVGVHRRDGADDLGALPGELFRRIRATALHIAAWPADVGSCVDGGEVVQHVEAGHLERAAHSLGASHRAGWRG